MWLEKCIQMKQRESAKHEGVFESVGINYLTIYSLSSTIVMPSYSGRLRVNGGGSRTAVVVEVEFDV